MPTVWMVVATGFHDDVRVRKMAHSVAGFDDVDRVVVLGMNRAGTAPNAVAADGGDAGIDVRLHGDPDQQFDARWAKAPARAAFLAWAALTIRRESAPGDLVHAHDLDTAPAGLAARRRSQHLVLDMHEVYSGRAGLPDRLQRALRAFEDVALPRADGVVFVSEAARDHYADRVDLPPHVVVTNSRSRDEVQPPAPPRDQPSRLVYVGRLTADRGLEQVVRMMGLLPDHTLDVIGFGPLEAHLRDVAARLGDDVTRRITFGAPISIDDVVPTLAGFDVGVVTTEPTCANHELTVSNKLFEYAAAGLPVLLSDVEEHRRLVAAHPFGAIARTVTPRDLAAAVRTLTDDPTAHAAAAAAARDLAVDRSWDHEMQGLRKLYESLLGT